MEKKAALPGAGGGARRGTESGDATLAGAIGGVSLEGTSAGYRSVRRKQSADSSPQLTRQASSSGKSKTPSREVGFSKVSGFKIYEKFLEGNKSDVINAVQVLDNNVIISEQPLEDDYTSEFENYIVEVIAKGSFSQVLGIKKKSQELNISKSFAVKYQTKQSDVAVHHFDCEINILSSLSPHPSIVRLFASFVINNDQRVACMELCRTDLFYYLQGKKRSNIPEKDARKLIAELCEGLVFLNQSKLIHRDIKAENLLLGYDGIWKWSDFGFAVRVDSEGEVCTRYEFRGTPEYIAPEIVLRGRREYSMYSDRWALGILLYEITCTPYIEGIYNFLKKPENVGRFSNEERACDAFISSMHDGVSVANQTIRSIINNKFVSREAFYMTSYDEFPERLADYGWRKEMIIWGGAALKRVKEERIDPAIIAKHQRSKLRALE